MGADGEIGIFKKKRKKTVSLPGPLLPLLSRPLFITQLIKQFLEYILSVPELILICTVIIRKFAGFWQKESTQSQVKFWHIL